MNTTTVIIIVLIYQPCSQTAGQVLTEHACIPLLAPTWPYRSGARRRTAPPGGWPSCSVGPPGGRGGGGTSAPPQAPSATPPRCPAAALHPASHHTPHHLTSPHTCGTACCHTHVNLVAAVLIKISTTFLSANLVRNLACTTPLTSPPLL